MVSPPVMSRTTSTLRPSLASSMADFTSSDRESMTASAPSSVASARLSSLDAEPMTRPAPKRFASWTAMVPTPPAAAWTRTVSPSRSCAEVLSRW